MQTQHPTTTSAKFPMQELEQIESVMRASSQFLASLKERRDTLTAQLDRITRPELAQATAPPKAIGPGLQYQGMMTRHWSAIDIHFALLRRLWTDFPERREAMARAMARHGWSRKYVALSPMELFHGKPESWARRFSRPLIDGWYVDTNLNKERMRKILPAAVGVTELQWGTDVIPYWHRTFVSNANDLHQPAGAAT